jgi:stress-induced morphogen
MGKVIETIEHRIREKLAPSLLEIRNDSHLHKSHNKDAAQNGAETHIHITIESEKLNGLTRIQKHQTIMELLADFMPTPLHAVSLKVL